MPNSFLSFYSFLLPVNHVTLSFTDFDIENNRQNCTTDFVEILDGNNYDAPLQGNMPIPSLSHVLDYTQGNQIFVSVLWFHVFFSDKRSSHCQLTQRRL